MHNYGSKSYLSPVSCFVNGKMEGTQYYSHPPQHPPQIQNISMKNIFPYHLLSIALKNKVMFSLILPITFQF